MLVVLPMKSPLNAVNRETTPTFIDARVQEEYVRTNNIAFGLLLLHIDAKYHHLVENFEKSWITWSRFKTF